VALRTPFFDLEVGLGACVVEFAGYEMPLHFGSIKEEHLAVRQRAGLFDVSHMGQVWLRGPGALSSVQRIFSNNMQTASIGQVKYGVMCNQYGGIIDDLLVYRDAEEFLLVVNAACHDKDLQWISRQAADCDVVDQSVNTAMLALQGPKAEAILQSCCDVSLTDLHPFHFVHGTVANAPTLISRTGYTGEDGFELLFPVTNATQVWHALWEAGNPLGLAACGLGARDTLRLEAGLRLYGQDMDETVDPLSCDLEWAVKFDKGDFLGRDALVAIKERGPVNRFVGMLVEKPNIARHGQAVLIDDREVGHVTSGTFGFTLACGIATGYVESQFADRTDFQIDVRGNKVPATSAALPFYKRATTGALV
jgi:aminomethyltransferase